MAALAHLRRSARSGDVVVALLGLGCGLAAGCGSSGADGSAAAGSATPTASASAAASARKPVIDPDKPVWVGISTPKEQVLKVLNPKGQEPYAGAKATLRGRIVMKGDPPPETTLTFPPECSEAASVYGRLFRTGKGGELADVLVAVTGYDAFVPPVYPAVKVDIKACAFTQRTLAVTFGQRIEVSNTDAVTSYMPYLDGSAYKAVMVAVPRGAPLTLAPSAPGQYLMRDAMKRPFMLGDVFVLKFATAAVTQADGRYEIAGLPVGKVRVDALLPVLRKTTGSDLELKEGDNTLDLELTYDRTKDQPVNVPEPVWGTRVPVPAASP